MNGNKTYIGMIAAGILSLLLAFDVVKWDQVDWIATVITTWTGVAVAHKGNKAIKALNGAKARPD